jgi:hypothetical protein
LDEKFPDASTVAHALHGSNETREKSVASLVLAKPAIVPQIHWKSGPKRRGDLC